MKATDEIAPDLELGHGFVASRWEGEARREILPEVWAMYERCYATIGQQFPNAEALLADAPIFDVTRDAWGHLRSVMVRKLTSHGFKNIASAQDGTILGRAA